MLKVIHVVIFVFITITGLASLSASAQTADDTLSTLKNEAKISTPSFQGFSAERGSHFFKQTHGNELSCSSCHTENPAGEGKHAKTGKLIKAMAPIANPERFTDSAKVEKWFKRNCNDVLDRVCTPQEKGDVLAYLLSVKN